MVQVADVDISSDVGEREGPDGLIDDLALLSLISSANVACGGHAGDARRMRIICDVAVSHGVAIGAQVSYVDRAGFGRRRLNVPAATLTAQVREQWERLADAAQAAGSDVAYLRPHGALYNTALVDAGVANAVLDATPAGTPVLCLAGTELARLAADRGHPVVTEIFADRAITDDGLLVPRSASGAVIDDTERVAARLVEWLRTGHLTSVNGRRVPTPARSICLHSDTPGAVTAARRVREVIVRSGSAVRAFAAPPRAAAEAAVPPPVTSVHQFGERAVVVHVPSATAAAFASAARRALGASLSQAVPAAHSVLLQFTSPVTAHQLQPLLGQLTTVAPEAAADEPEPITLDVRYNGADLAEVAARTDLSIDEVVALHAGTTYRVGFFGFAPGFAYLTGLPRHLQLPRRATPRTVVPAGAVAIAASYTAVYPRSSPGGWHLLGHTEAAMFDPHRSPPTLITPGARVRFRGV